MVLAIGIMAGCTVKESAELVETKLVFTASRESVTPDTKTVRQEDGSVCWGPEEEISLFCGSGTNGGSKFTSINTSTAETAEFEGSVNNPESVDYWAVYPYSTDNSCDGLSITTVIPSQQKGVDGNFSDNAFPAMAMSASKSLTFQNICGGLKFSVSREDIETVTIKSNNGEPIAGKVKVAFNADGQPEVSEVIEGQDEVTLTAPYGGCFTPGKYYYITLLPASLDGGVTLFFTTDLKKGTLTSDKAQTVKRSIFGVLNNVDSQVAEWDSFVPNPDWTTLPFRHQSLFMRFTATWCGWCPRMNKSIKQAQEDYPDKIQHLALHGSGSSLYYSKVSTLMTQYKISGFPTGIVDGRIEIDNESIKTTARNIVNAVKETESTYGTVSGARIATTLDGNNLDINMRIYFKAPGDYLVTVLLVEDGIVASQDDYEEGTHTSYVHDNVCRYAVTAIKGASITQTGEFSTRNMKWSTTINKKWNAENVRVLAYVQAAYGDRTKISTADYGDYYVDNCFTVKAGETLDLELEAE